MNEFFVNLLAYCGVPLTAWRIYTRLYNRMEAEAIFEPPDIQLFLIFTVYAGWSMVIFILLSGAWSDVMYLVLFYLILLAPILMLVVAFSLLSQYRLSKYHTGAFVASGIYIFACALLIFIGVAAALVSILAP